MTSRLVRIAMGLVGAFLIVGWLALSLDYVALVIGGLICAYVATRLVGARRTTDWTYALGGIFGALLSLFLYSALTGSSANLDGGSATLVIVVGLCVGGGLALITAAMHPG